MPDDRIHSPEPAPHDWHAAFAALPPEAPDADAWARIARALPRRRRPRWPMWLAAAAVLAMAAVVPWRLSMDAVTQPDAATPVAGASDASVPETADTTPEDARTPASDRAVASTRPIVPGPAAPSDDGATRPASQPIALTRTDEPEADAPAAAASAPRQDDAPQAATTEAQPRVASNTGATGPTDAPATADDAASELERLYAESAKLEALVAMARDDRVATTGAAAALASRYDARVAAIDAQLMQPDIAATERLRLWRERVDAMRGLASFESTQRLLAARGERYDAMLVSID